MCAYAIAFVSRSLCMRVAVYGRVCVWQPVYVCAFAYFCVNIYLYSCLCFYVRVSLCLCVCTRVYVRVFVLEYDECMFPRVRACFGVSLCVNAFLLVSPFVYACMCVYVY